MSQSLIGNVIQAKIDTSLTNEKITSQSLIGNVIRKSNKIYLRPYH